jgi:hypothetical protein
MSSFISRISNHYKLKTGKKKQEVQKQENEIVKKPPIVPT